MSGIILFLTSFLSVSALLLPKGTELLAVLLAVLLFSLAKQKIPTSSLNNIPKKPMIRSISLSGLLVIYFIINCYGRYSDLNMMLAMIVGIVLLLLSLPLTLRIGSAEKDLPDLSSEKTESPFAAIGISLVIGFVTVLILSQSSPLYPCNNWSDANCFLTLGRTPLHGRKMYSEVFDHKGPLLYLIHTVSALISPDSFLGMYIIQSLLCAMTHHFMVKTAGLFTKKDRTVYLLSVPALFLLFSSNAYFYGDSTEELLLPFVISGIYVIFKSFRKEEDLSKKDMLILGTGAAFAFWIKFTLCGFWIGAILYMIVRLIRRHEAKKLLKYALWFCVPCVAISIPILIYLAATSTLSDMFTVYFYNNMFSYQSLNGGIPIFGKLPYSLILTIMKLYTNHVMAALIFSAIFYLSSLKDKRYITFYSVTFVTTAFFVFFGDSQMFYYIFGLSAFALPGIIPWILLVRKALAPKDSRRLLTAISAAALLSFCVYAFSVSCATFEILTKKSDLPSYKFASYMDTSENVSILNFDFPDSGFYSAAGSVPTEKYYCKYNLDDVLPEIMSSRIQAIAECRVEYVITRNHMYSFKNYDLIASADLTEIDFDGEVGTDTYFLYRKKEAVSS